MTGTSQDDPAASRASGSRPSAPAIDTAASQRIAYAAAPWDSRGTGPRVTGVSTVVTAPAGSPLLLVKVETDDPGLIGWGCASTPQRTTAIQKVIDDYLAPMLVGRRAADIEDYHHLMELSPYWRGGAIENSALSGIDMALWDIKGKAAGMPVHQLIGGQTRSNIPVYGHASGDSHAEVIDNVQSFIDQGYGFVRAQIAIAGADTYGASRGSSSSSRAAVEARSLPWRSRAYEQAIPPLFEAIRESIGWNVELLHDVHERLPVPSAIRLARSLEPYGLFFLEDAIAPEDLSHYREMRSATTTPQAVGETFSDVHTFVPLLLEKSIDYARIRMCAIGGLTPTIKLAHLCELTGSRIAVHGPGDVSPVGHAAGIAVDASSRAFGVQEAVIYPEVIYEVFPGAPRIVDGAIEVSQSPGLGIEVNETKAGLYPPGDMLKRQSWTLLRNEDGSPARP